MKQGCTPDDREKMQKWALDSSSFGNKFMVKAKEAASASSTDVDAAPAVVQSEADEINVALTAPALHKTLTKDHKIANKALMDSLTACEVSLKAFRDLPRNATVTDDMIAYNDLVICRKFLGTYIVADTAMQVQVPEGLQKLSLVLPRTPGSAGAASGNRSVPAVGSPPPTWRASGSQESVYVSFVVFMCSLASAFQKRGSQQPSA